MITCQVCGTTLNDIDEPCPNCLPNMAERPPTLSPISQDKPFVPQDKPDYEAIVRALVADTDKRLRSIRGTVAAMPVKVQRQIGTMLIIPIESRKDLIERLIAQHTPQAKPQDTPEGEDEIRMAPRVPIDCPPEKEKL